MKKIFFLLFLCFTTVNAFTQIPALAWANSVEGLTSPYSLDCSSGYKDITTDAAGNVYSVGYYYGSIDVNPGSGTTALSATESGTRAFITKSNPDGTVIWAKTLQGTGVSEVFSVKVDLNGNVFFTGKFSDTVDFDPNVGVFNLVSVSYHNMYMAKFDSNGNFVWAKKISPSSSILVDELELDASGNPIYIGIFSGVVDFDPNAGIVNLTGSSNSFILKLDANGSFVFVKHFAASSANYITKIIVKPNGNILLAGSFSSTTDFDPDAGVAQLSVNNFSTDAYICELNNNGNYLWAKSFGGGSIDQINTMDLDSYGNILVAGTFRNYTDFDPGSGVFLLQTSSSNLDDMFVAKYSSTGDFIWAKQIGSPTQNYTNENVREISVDASNNVSIVGFFYNSVDFNPDSGVFTLATSSNRNTFVCNLNSEGSFNYAFNFDMGNSIAHSECTGIVFDNFNSWYICGHTNAVCDVDPSSAVLNFNNEFYQGYVLKFSAPTSEASFSLSSNSACVDKPINLVSTNSALQNSWHWTSTGGTIVDPNAASTSISFPTNGIYTVTLTVTSGLGTTLLTQTINVNNNPSLIVQASPNIVCLGQSTTLWATHSSPSLSWNSGQVSNYITVYPTVNTTYTATITGSNGCTTSASQFIEVATDASTTISVANDTICAGESVTITANGASDFVWSTGATTQSITVNPTSFSAYSVTGITGTCQATANQVIYVIDPPTVSLQSSANTSCDGASVTLTAFGGDSYMWSTSETTSSIAVSPSIATTYTVTGTNLSGCSNFASQTISVGTSPNINISASNNTPCAGSPITLTATGGVTYFWGGGQTTNAISVSPTVNTTYTVTGVNASGCQASFQKVINVDPLPILNIQSTATSICVGSPVTLTASGGNTYSWNSGQTTANITVSPTNTTLYTVTGTNSFNCQNSASVNIVVSQMPVVSFTNPVTTFCTNGASYNFVANPSGGTFTGNGLTGSTFNPLQAGIGTHTISYTYSNGNCENTETINVVVNDCASLSDLYQSSLIKVYPIPAKDQLQISGLEANCLLELFNENGQLILKELTSSDQSILNVASISSGIYNLSIQSGAGRQIVKVVIQH